MCYHIQCKHACSRNTCHCLVGSKHHLLIKKMKCFRLEEDYLFFPFQVILWRWTEKNHSIFFWQYIITFHTIMHQQTADKGSFYLILRAERLILELYNTTHCVARILDTTLMRQSINIFPTNSLLKIFRNAAKKWEYLQFSLHFLCPFILCYTNHSASIAFCHSPTKSLLKLLEQNAHIRWK
jgi:hypothetical protein